MTQAIEHFEQAIKEYEELIVSCVDTTGLQNRVIELKKELDRAKAELARAEATKILSSGIALDKLQEAAEILCKIPASPNRQEDNLMQEVRSRNGFTQTTLGQLIGVPQYYVSNFENSGSCGRKKLALMCRVYSILLKHTWKGNEFFRELQKLIAMLPHS